MTYRYLHDLAAVARKAGLNVVELPGWRGRGRPSSTGNHDPFGVLWHHTGGSKNDRGYADWLANVGRPDLPAPLCHYSIDRQGTVYVVAAGRTNHGGKAKASGPMPAGDGNAMYIGVECMNTGSEGWPKAQYDAMVKLGAALAKHYGWSDDHNRAHKETSLTGKWDPGMLDMTDFREDIRLEMKRNQIATRAERRKARRKIKRADKNLANALDYMEAEGIKGRQKLKRARVFIRRALKKTHRKNEK